MTLDIINTKHSYQSVVKDKDFKENKDRVNDLCYDCIDW